MSSQGKYVICPFFRSQGSLYITCEGIKNIKTTSIHFESPAEKTIYRRAHCESFDYERTCDICRQILKKYSTADSSAPRDMLTVSQKRERICRDR